MISIKDIEVSIGKKKILTSVNLNIGYGKVIGILGPNGVGKSTLLNAISKFAHLDRGEILINGKNIENYSTLELACELSFMSQSFSVNFPYTVEQIVSMGRYPFCKGNICKEDKKIIYESMKEADVYCFKDRKITELSGGEKQRVHFAKTLCQDTNIILIDEGFSSMDIYYQIRFIKLLKDKASCKNKTIIFIMHDLSMARKYCDELLILKNGKTYSYGKSDEVLSEKTLLDVFNVNGRFISNCLELI